MGKDRTQTITEAQLLALTVADNDRTVRDGSGLSGKVHAGVKGRVSVHFRYRYRFDGKSREMPLGAWPRDSLESIRQQFDETKLRVECGGDPAGQKKAVIHKIRLEQAEIVRQEQQLAERERQQAEQTLTVQAMFDEWHSEAMAENTADHAEAVRRLFELHLLPRAGALRVSDVKSEHIRQTLVALISAGKISRAISLRIYVDAMFSWAGKRRPWGLLFDISPVESINLKRLLPDGYQDWSDRVLVDDEIIELRNRFQLLRHAFEFRDGSRRGLATPIRREEELAVWITLATMVRINEICSARWREHINFAKATWFIPPEHAKNGKGHTIFLSAFSMKLLRELHTMTGRTPFLLPHPHDSAKPYTTAILQCAIGARQSLGKWKKKSRMSGITASSLALHGGPWSWHDLRRTGSTIMQGCGVDERVVDRCLNHSIHSQARRKGLDARLLRTYQQYNFEKEMRQAWDTLGEYLMKLDGIPAQINGPGAVVVANDDVGPQQLESA
ncbi:tyrosine-type recombinase/integrase [Paraburkholderia acidisoli]|uniref:tyrosine-type recombinase/integrase n=1 Tax=Paraburkholderia acidisoli TaxID=2571748 RepID=UPI00131AE553|nr:site-specific integrase [Paraburkholderia acidisoli]